jgi:5'-nucleotidase/2',3'-cyclic-nucleotide 2'-phosphodiesterase/3'-nucleotidase
MKLNKFVRYTSVVAFLLTQVFFAQPRKLTILHTSDIHGAFLPHPATWVKGYEKPLVGGFKELQFKVDSIRQLRPSTLLVDEGDVMTGTPITEFEYRGAMGGALFEMMNMIGYNAWCPGNHDFDISQQNFLKLVGLAQFPTLSANLAYLNGTPLPGTQPYVIIEREGLKIGIIGAILKSLPTQVSKKSIDGINVLPVVQNIQQVIDKIDPITDVIIALTHEGLEDDSVLAVNTKGLDIIFAGHDHRRLNKPKVVNGVILCEAGPNAENLGVLNITVENDRVIDFQGNLVQLWYNPNHPVTRLSEFADSMEQVIEKNYAETIGTLEGDWMRKDGESGIGNFVADAQREVVSADLGFINTQGVRNDLRPGPITKQDIFKIMPFRNIVCTFPLTGIQVKEFVLKYISRGLNVQTSGISFRYRKQADGTIEVTKFEINGKPFDEKQTYRAAASDYFIGEAKRYLGFEVPENTPSDETVFGAIEKKVRMDKVITSAIENRISEEK